MTFEGAYWGPRPSTSEAVPALIALLEVYHDTYTRGKIIELLGESEDKSVIPVLEVELKNSDEGIRSWAKRAIDDLEKGERWQQDYEST